MTQMSFLPWRVLQSSTEKWLLKGKEGRWQKIHLVTTLAVHFAGGFTYAIPFQPSFPVISPLWTMEAWKGGNLS